MDMGKEEARVAPGSQFACGHNSKLNFSTWSVQVVWDYIEEGIGREEFLVKRCGSWEIL